MGKDSGIEWTHHTFNPWWGCVKISPGCKNCYAETLSHRFGDDCWGPGKDRKQMSDGHWKKPLNWNRAAEAKGERHRVFTASMADVMEDPSNMLLNALRARLWNLIEDTPSLDWLILTKRPENIPLLIPDEWLDRAPSNTWWGTSVEDQEQATKRIKALMAFKGARLRFLSVEPLLGPVDITNGAVDDAYNRPTAFDRNGYGIEWIDPGDSYIGVNWVIVGGESGAGFRMMEPAWAEALKKQCRQQNTPFFMKQMADKQPIPDHLVLREFPKSVPL